MEVDIRQEADVVIVDLKGRLVAGTGAEQLQAIMNEIIASDWKKVILNLSEVTKIDSAGIGELVASDRLAKRFGSTLKLVHLTGQIKEIFELSQLLPLLTIFESEEAALAAFRSS